jgi:hypothetical protein
MISTPAAVPYGDWGRLESAWRLTSGHGVCAHFRVRLCLLVVIALLVGAEVFAQNDPPSSPSREENRSPAPAQDDVQQPSHRWDWTGDLSAAFGFNYQRRKFTDFQEWESQNWFMGTGTRSTGRGTVTVASMLSLEPFTIQDLGSPQVFQTGEIFQRAPLIDYQHPHDLLMQLGVAYRHPLSETALTFSGWLVGSPAFGPPVFMHRRSAVDNPQVPLSHHYQDSTHISNGVLTVGLEVREFRFETSWFRGREPDDNRTDIDTGPLDSWAGRVEWTRGSWRVQFSGARLHEPEILEPFDHTKLSASVMYSWRMVDATLAWGETREIHGNLDAYLLEAHAQLNTRNAIYGRAELAAKVILDKGGFHPIGFQHPHRISRVAAFTAGYVHDFVVLRYGRVGVGADMTAYTISDNLRESYGSPQSFHVFVRVRTDRPQGHVH